MDLTIDLEEYRLNIRAAGVIIHDGKVLVHKNLNNKHYALIGGRVMIGESSEETVKREVFEELGKEVQIRKYLTTIENFFEKENKKYHEILFLYQLEFVNEEDQKIQEVLDNVEGKEYLKYMWLDLNHLEEYELLPKVTKELLMEGKFPNHKINQK